MDTQNVVVGLASENTIKIGAYGASEAECSDVGAIDGGVSFEKDETQYSVKVDQIPATVRKITTDVSLKIKFSMAEATVENLARAMGLPDSAVSGSTLKVGIPQSETEYAVYINTKGPQQGFTKFTLHKVRPTGKTSPAYKKDDKTLFDVEFEVLADVSQPAGEEFCTVYTSGTDTTPPTVVMTTPASGGTRTTSDPVVLTITEANLINQNTVIYGDTVSIFLQGTPNSLVSGSVVYSTSAKTITFTPSSAWQAGTYQVMVSKGLKDINGNALAAVYNDYFTVSA